MDTVIAPRDERTQPQRIDPGYPQTPWRNPTQPLVRRRADALGAHGPARSRRSA